MSIPTDKLPPADPLPLPSQTTADEHQAEQLAWEVVPADKALGSGETRPISATATAATTTTALDPTLVQEVTALEDAAARETNDTVRRALEASLAEARHRLSTAAIRAAAPTATSAASSTTTSPASSSSNVIARPTPTPTTKSRLRYAYPPDPEGGDCAAPPGPTPESGSCARGVPCGCDHERVAQASSGEDAAFVPREDFDRFFALSILVLVFTAMVWAVAWGGYWAAFSYFSSALAGLAAGWTLDLSMRTRHGGPVPWDLANERFRQLAIMFIAAACVSVVATFVALGMGVATRCTGDTQYVWVNGVLVPMCDSRYSALAWATMVGNLALAVLCGVTAWYQWNLRLGKLERVAVAEASPFASSAQARPVVEV